MPQDKPPVHPQGRRVSVEAKNWFYEQVKSGRNPYKVGEELGISRSTVRKYTLKMNESYGGKTPTQTAARIAADAGGADSQYPDPKRSLELLSHPQAKQAWQEFGYWRSLLLGRRNIAWQLEMVQILMSWWESGQATAGTEESEVIKGIVNTPPGGGKSTTITHDFPGWLITRNRDIRIALGARTSPQSKKYVRRLRTTLEKNVLLNIYFGRFKPLEPEEWRQDAFIVDGVQGHEATIEYKLALAGFDPEDRGIKKRLKDPRDSIHETLDQISQVFLTGEKESTVAMLSQEMGFLGGRFDINLWDDLCDKNNSRTPDQREALVEWWFSEAESRCEPGGLVGLIGTRFGKFDLFRHCRDLTYMSEDEVDEATMKALSSSMSEEEMAEIREDIEKEMVDKHDHAYSDLATPDSEKGMRISRRIYRYHRFPAHDDAGCLNPVSLKNSDHISCVLDPKRFSYRHLIKVKASDPRRYNLTYQQMDDSTADNLVQTIWLTGGAGEDGFVYPGCYDYDRALGDIPEHLKRENCYSLATLDPSAQNYWAFEWWIYDKSTDTDYLIDLLRVKIQSGTFLDYDILKRKFSGIAEDWQNRSHNKSWDISLWIIEQNAAQRYLFQYNWVTQWMQKHHVLIKGHQTHRNKADEELGVETLAPRYRTGRVSLPYNQGDMSTRVAINEFATELTEWPDGLTEDMVMGHWFHQVSRETYPESMLVSRTEQGPRHIYQDQFPEYLMGEKPPKKGHYRGHKAAQLRRREGS